MTDVTLAFTVAAEPAVTFAAATADDGAAGVLSGLALPFGVPSLPAQDGNRYRFTAGPDNAAELVDAVREHDDDALVGRLSQAWEQTPTGLNARARIFATSRGRDIVTEAREGARTAFSASTLIHDYTVAKDGVRDVSSWTARHLGVVRRPAFAQTTGFQVSCSAHTPARKDTTMPPEDDPQGGPAVAELPTVAQLAEQVRGELDMPTIAQLAEQVRGILHTDEDHHPLAQFSTFDAFMAGFMEADEEKRAALQTAFAIPDQITGNNPGVMPPGWRTDIKMRLDARRPAIVGTGGSIGLPPTGMDANWPYYEGDLDAIVSRQIAQKNELSGVRIDIKKATAPIKTAGTISDISYQLLLRSSPSYFAAFMRICLAAWARYTEATYEAALVAGGTQSATLLSATLADADTFRGEMFNASSKVEDATGAPASLVLVDPATWVTLGGMPGLHNQKYGTQNAAGTASASTLEIDVNGLRIRRGPFLASTMVVTNEDAASFAESGPRTATEEDVKKLGRNVAVWGMYEDAEVYFPAGVQVYDEAAV